MKRFLAISLLLGAAAASAQQVYKHVDEKGNVTYSQTRPAPDAQAVKVPPARPQHWYGQTAEEQRRAAQMPSYEAIRQEQLRIEQQQREAMEEARKKQVAALRAECIRNRGSDCDDPATIARMEAERGPSQYRPRAR